MKEYKNCKLCPRNCNIDRVKNKGICGANSRLKVALVSTHYFEEPCISLKNGSGTVFFSNCNLKCVYCQNYKISRDGYGKYISVKRLSEIFLEQQERGVNNINLVTPTMYIPSIAKALKIAKENGLHIPVVYNSSGYENVESLKLLDGLIDIYLPDFKYATDKLGLKYSRVKDYSKKVVPAILEMYRQVGKPLYDNNGVMQKGVIIRHMILPNNVLNSKMVLKTIKENFGENVVVSVMAQYFPSGDAYKCKEINRKITKDELDEVYNYLDKIGIENGYIQELGEHEEEYVPNFNLKNV